LCLRRMWARIMKDKFEVREDSDILRLAFFSGCQASRWTAQQSLNNIVRGTIAALVQVLSGSHVCGVARYDQALCLPTRESVRIAARTQQIIADETGVPDTIDPLAGSYFVEALTDDIEDSARRSCLTLSLSLSLLSLRSFPICFSSSRGSPFVISKGIGSST